MSAHDLTIDLHVPVMSADGNVVTFRKAVTVRQPFVGDTRARDNDSRLVSVDTVVELPDGPATFRLTLPVRCFGRHQRISADADVYRVKREAPVIQVQAPDVVVWNTIEQLPREITVSRDKRGQLTGATVKDA